LYFILSLAFFLEKMVSLALKGFEVQMKNRRVK
jgi:hypothetical protein